MATISDSIVTFARAQLGKPYVYGAKGPNAYDCSGLVYAAYKAAGLPVSYRRAVDLGKAGTAVDQAHAQPGDVVYYDEPGDTDHVGIYIGNGQMIDAPTEGKPVETVGIGHPTSIRHYMDLGGPVSADGKAQETSTVGGIFDAAKGAADSLNPLSLFSSWQSDAASILLKLLVAGAASALVIVGAWEALHDKDQK
jgi:hypothetical protein